MNSIYVGKKKKKEGKEGSGEDGGKAYSFVIFKKSNTQFRKFCC